MSKIESDLFVRGHATYLEAVDQSNGAQYEEAAKQVDQRQKDVVAGSCPSISTS